MIDGGTPEGNVVLDGSGTHDGLTVLISGSGSSISKLQITGFAGAGILLEGDDNRVMLSTIYLNGGAGVAVLSGFGNKISRNSIYGNGGPAIDLGNDGVTANDVGDTDTGPNGLLNFPILSGAVPTVDPSGNKLLNITGWLDGVAGSSYDVEFYGSDTCHSSGAGEGHLYLGQATLAVSNAGGVGVRLHAAGRGCPDLRQRDRDRFRRQYLRVLALRGDRPQQRLLAHCPGDAYDRQWRRQPGRDHGPGARCTGSVSLVHDRGAT